MSNNQQYLEKLSIYVYQSYANDVVTTCVFHPSPNGLQEMPVTVFRSGGVWNSQGTTFSQYSEDVPLFNKVLSEGLKMSTFDLLPDWMQAQVLEQIRIEGLS